MLYYAYTFPFFSYIPNNNLFSNFPTNGVITKKYPKYNIAHTCPISIYGLSTGFPPIHVNNIKFPINIQYHTFAIGLNCVLLTQLVCTCGNTNNTNKLANNANTPNNLFGIALNIAYANKKYHSG